MTLFEQKLDEALKNVSDSPNLLCRVLPCVDHQIKIIPGQCWSLDGLKEVWENEYELDLPFRGRGLYGFQVTNDALHRWPFKWEWSFEHAQDHRPVRQYNQEQIKQFMKCPTVDGLSRVEEALGNPARDGHAIALDLVYSIKPGVRVDAFGRHDHFGAVVNVPVLMYRIATGTEGPEGTSFHKVGLDSGRKAIRWSSI